MIKLYNFNTPELISDKQKVLFKRLHEMYLKTFDSILSSFFLAKVTSTVLEINQTKFEEFLGEEKKFVFLFKKEIEEEMIFVKIDPIFFSAVLDKLLGGKVKIVNKVTKLTEVEIALLSKKFDEIFDSIFKTTEHKSTLISSFLEATYAADKADRNGVSSFIDIKIDNLESNISIFFSAFFIRSKLLKN
jgi:flagellar motor switch protein FliM